MSLIHLNWQHLSHKNVSDDTRRFNLQEGLTVTDDQLPKRFYKDIFPETGMVITEEQMQVLLQEYYKARGWNEKGELLS